MEELFRFIMTRPAQAAKDVTVPVTPHPDYLGRLRTAHARGGAAAVGKTAQEFSASKQALRSIDELKGAHRLISLAARQRRFRHAWYIAEYTARPRSAGERTRCPACHLPRAHQPDAGPS